MTIESTEISTKAEKKFTKGGFFIVQPTEPSSVFTPEDYSEEHYMLRKSIQDFLDKEIEPNKLIFDSKEGTELAPLKLEKFGELGFLGLAVPEAFGGFGCDIKTDLIASEILADSWSFSQSVGVQKGLGISSILFYGTEQQQSKYLSKIVSGALKCSYCLTEPGAGSDAGSGKTKASISSDGTHYILNGQKMWITNSGFADVFTVFCKIEDDENLSCLIVEKAWGVTLGEEERKLGIHGSSTRQVFFEDVKVPIENLLGTRNKGFKIAMNALNMGRLMIGVAGSIISKRAFDASIDYANQRVQFKVPISSFGALQEKIANMATRIFALESMWNRVGGDMDNYFESILEEVENPLKGKQKVAENYAVECSIIKVFGSEIEQYVVDESLQMHGGMGFSAESDISILYRNIRGNRIYEGTNEINRLLIPATMIRRAFKGQLPLMEEAMKILPDFLTTETLGLDSSQKFGSYISSYLDNLKSVILICASFAVQKFQQSIKDEQEVLTRLSDLIIACYAIESSALRALKDTSNNVHLQLSELLCYETQAKSNQAVRELLSVTQTNQEAAINYQKMEAMLSLPFKDVKELRQEIAKYFIEKNKYNLQ